MNLLYTRLVILGVSSMAFLHLISCNQQQEIPKEPKQEITKEPKQEEIFTADPAVRIIVFNAYDDQGTPGFLETYLQNRVKNITRIELREDWYAKSNYIKNF